MMTPNGDINEKTGAEIPNDQQFGRRIQELRQNKGWSLKQLGDIVGATPAALSKLESGESLPRLTLAVELAKAFDVSLDWLTGLGEFPQTTETSIRETLGLDQSAIDNLKRINSHKKVTDDENPKLTPDVLEIYSGFFPELSNYQETNKYVNMYRHIEKYRGNDTRFEVEISSEGYKFIKNFQYTPRHIPPELSLYHLGNTSIDIEKSIVNSMLSDWELITLLARYSRCNEVGIHSRGLMKAIECDALIFKQIENKIESIRNKIVNEFNLGRFGLSVADKDKISKKYNEYFGRDGKYAKVEAEDMMNELKQMLREEGHSEEEIEEMLENLPEIDVDD